LDKREQRPTPSEFGALALFAEQRAAHVEAEAQPITTKVEPNLLAALPRDKWLLASLLQKAIRRGHGSYAIAAARLLTDLDCAYVARRLPIIAYEDIGIANIALVDAVRRSSHALTHLPATNAEASAEDIAAALAASVKSRTACDLTSLCLFSPDATDLEWRLARASVISLIKVATDSRDTYLRRALAVRRLMGIRSSGSPPITLAKSERAFATRELFLALKLPMAVVEVAIRGTGTEGLNATLPLAYALMQASPVVAIESRNDVECASPTLCGMPAYTADMYTRPGQRAFRALLRSAPQLQDILNCHITRREQVRCLGFMVFHTEGSVLDRWLSFPAANKILADVEAVECGHVGISDPWVATAIKEWLLANRALLNAARAEALKNAQQLSDAEADERSETEKP
jgi:hypothetical protein